MSAARLLNTSSRIARFNKNFHTSEGVYIKAFNPKSRNLNYEQDTGKTQIKTWYVKEGDIISQFDKIREVQGDKKEGTIKSGYDGIVKTLYHKVDGTVLVGKPLMDPALKELSSRESLPYFFESERKATPESLKSEVNDLDELYREHEDRLYESEDLPDRHWYIPQIKSFVTSKLAPCSEAYEYVPKEPLSAENIFISLGKLSDVGKLQKELRRYETEHLRYWYILSTQSVVISESRPCADATMINVLRIRKRRPVRDASYAKKMYKVESTLLRESEEIDRMWKEKIAQKNQKRRKGEKRSRGELKELLPFSGLKDQLERYWYIPETDSVVIAEDKPCKYCFMVGGAIEPGEPTMDLDYMREKYYLQKDICEEVQRIEEDLWFG